MTTKLHAFSAAGERRRPAPFVIVVIAVSVFFLGWVALTRGSARTQSEAVGTATAQRNAQTVAYYGNGQLKVLNFYANPPEVRRGHRTLVCYSLSQPSAGPIEPPVGETSPSPGRCTGVTAAQGTENQINAQKTARV